MARGISSAADVFRVTVDGEDLGRVFAEYQRTLEIQNNAQDSLRAMLTHHTTAAGAVVPQSPDIDIWEDESEYGVPVSMRGPGMFTTVGFNLKFRDVAARFTHIFLRDASRTEIDAVHNTILAGDNKQVFQSILGCLFNATPRVNPEQIPVLGVYNADGSVPPPWNGKTFSGTHTHLISSGAATLDGQDLLDLYKHVAEHGYGDPGDGGRVVIFLNPDEAEASRAFRVTNGPHDFIHAAGSDVYLTDKQMVGQPVPNRLGSVPIFGSYGPALLSESYLVPPGYAAAVATYGPNDMRNPIAFREHIRSELRGLRQIPGDNVSYPLENSYYQRGWGTGVRFRGAAAVMQITAGAYSIPADYATVLA